MTNAEVLLWGSRIGAVSWHDDRDVAVFQYVPEFVKSGIQLSPLMMPAREAPYSFPGLRSDAFKGLPGLLADSLPDKFGNAVIDAWLAGSGRSAASFNPVERLCYTGRRGMGALEYKPALFEPRTLTKMVEVDHLVELANLVLNQRTGLIGQLHGEDDHQALNEILRVGTSAGGARAKAVLAWNPVSGEFRSGQVTAPPDYEYWILKFDGITNNRDRELADPQGFGIIEYVYYRMALEAGIEMTTCRLHHEGGRSHFMTRRFDRLADGGKLHMQTLAALTHVDYNVPGLFSYEEALMLMKKLDLSPADLEQLVLRAIFNVVGCNCDDHVKNIAFLMDRAGRWCLAPAYDMTYAFNPAGQWTSRHQMSIHGKRDGIEREDLVSLAAFAGIKTRRAKEMIEQVLAAFIHWPEWAAEDGVPDEQIRQVGNNLETPL